MGLLTDLLGDGNATSGASRIEMNAATLDAVRGTPARGNPNVSWSYWLLDSATQEAVAAAHLIPTGWASVDIDVWWVNAGAGTGNVLLGYRLHDADPGDALSTGINGSVTVAAAAENIVTYTRIGTGVSVVADELATIVMERNGTAANDTLPNDIGVLALVVTKAS